MDMEQALGSFEVIQDGAVIQTGTVERDGDGWVARAMTLPPGAVWIIRMKEFGRYPVVTWFPLSPDATLEIGMEDN